MVNQSQKQETKITPVITRIGLRRKQTAPSYYSLLNSPKIDYDYMSAYSTSSVQKTSSKTTNKNQSKPILKGLIKKEPEDPPGEIPDENNFYNNKNNNDNNNDNNNNNNIINSDDCSNNTSNTTNINVNSLLTQNFNESLFNINPSSGTPETYLIDRYKYAVRHIKQGLSVEEACNKYRISKGALLKCLSGGTAPRGKKTRLTESEENEIVEWLINYKDLKYNDAIHLVFEQVAQKFEKSQRPNPFHNGKPSMDWWYDFLSRHPQIMASKPDWIMRGKVNDQYIKDVQSGHLKCTKFRRALLSAIQYIRSLNDSINTSITENIPQVQVDSNNNNNNNNNNNKNQFKENSGSQSKKLRNNKNDQNSLKKKFRSSVINSKIMSSFNLNNNYNQDTSAFKPFNRKGLNEKLLNQEPNNDEEEEDREDEENINQEEENETNIDNVTFITEIFNSELENHNFDYLIDPNILIDKNDNQKQVNEFHNDFLNSHNYNSPIYDINTEHLDSPDYLIEDNVDKNTSNEPSSSLLFNSHLLNSSLNQKNNLNSQMFNRQYHHLIVPDDDENE